MALLEQANGQAEEAKRILPRVIHVGTKLNEVEVRELAELAEKRKQTQGELIRGLILRELLSDAGGPQASPELVEIVNLRLLLLNLLRPSATGQAITEKRYDDVVAEARKRKEHLALETLKGRLKEKTEDEPKE
jgi:hypothetical protein